MGNCLPFTSPPIPILGPSHISFTKEKSNYLERKFVIEGELLDELCGKIRCLETKLEKYQSLNKELAIENNTLKEAQRVKIDYNREVNKKEKEISELKFSNGLLSRKAFRNENEMKREIAALKVEIQYLIS